MKKGFTMIELIFVIVILGILAAVAIPRLSATRDDATISRLSADLATLVSDAGSYYTAQGVTNWAAAATTWSDVTNVVLQSAANTMNTAGAVQLTAAAFMNSDATHNCFHITTTADGNLTVANGADVASTICTGAQALSANLIRTHSFGGTGITR